MKASAVALVLLALICATAPPAQSDPVDPHTLVASLAADLTQYWRTTLGAQVPSYQGPQAIVYYSQPIQTPCGPSTIHHARYCPGDGVIYLDETWIDELLAAGDYTPIAILAHEWPSTEAASTPTYARSNSRPTVSSDCSSARSRTPNGSTPLLWPMRAASSPAVRRAQAPSLRGVCAYSILRRLCSAPT